MDARTSDSRTYKELQVGTAPAILVHTSDNTIRSSSKWRRASEVPGKRKFQVEEMMKSNHLVLLLTIVAFASPIALAQQGAQDVPVLTLDDAVSIALTNNRLVKNSVLEAQKYDFQV
ncbi:MAG: hypothetical protein WBQ19_01125, partial [Terriglobales bacterium]